MESVARRFEKVSRESFLEYMLKETAVSIRMMLESGDLHHSFNIGKTLEGVELSLLMIIVPTSVISHHYSPAQENSNSPGTIN